jgi:ABC-type multidrug transport system fused ATPase/permease subunit
MKSFSFKTILPHIIAIVIFLLITLIFCRPALDPSLIMKQGDVTGWQGMSHQAIEYKEQHGHLPLWLTNMFCGMPAYQVALEGAWSPLSIINNIFQLGLSQPLNFFFLACLSFYFLCSCLGIRPYTSIIGAIGFAFCSFSPIIITAGHNTQMLALAYAPSVLGAIILLFRKKYFIGFSISSLLLALQIAQGHQQISYYLFIIIGFMVISYFVFAVKEKEIAHFFKSLSLLILAGILGIAANALVLMTTFDYAKDSKRGGQLVMDSTNKTETVKDGKTQGLSREYAFQWSYGKGETWGLMFPGVMGYGFHYAQNEEDQYFFPKLDEHSKTAKFLTDSMFVPEDQAVNIAFQKSQNLYWGDQPFTNGPVYLGAVICFLFLTSLFLLKGKQKWWIMAASLFGILLSLGSHFPTMNYFLFDHMPFYNKLRVPTMALVIPQILFPLASVLALHELINGDVTEHLKKTIKAFIATAAVFILAYFSYVSFDYSKENKQRTQAFNSILKEPADKQSELFNKLNQEFKPEVDNQIYEEMVGNLNNVPTSVSTAKSRQFLNAIRQDRASLFLSDIIRSLIFVLIGGLMIFLFLKKKINALVLIIGITLTATVDLLQFGSKYLNNYSFASKEAYEEQEFPLSEADRMIMADKDPNFRVMNTSGLDESKTSYYHKSIGGYHPAKLGIYDDLIAYQLSGSPNMNVINMLNTKYFIQQTDKGKFARINPMAMGNAWFVNQVKMVNGPVEEMKALYSFNPAETAIVDNKFKKEVTIFSPSDSLSTIKLTHFDNDTLHYKTSTTSSKLAVFSEIYYKDWNAYIDGKPVPIFKTNYVLRGLMIPEGQHEVEFRFEPAVFKIGKNVSNIASWLVLLLVIGMLYVLFSSKKESAAEAKI